MFNEEISTILRHFDHLRPLLKPRHFDAVFHEMVTETEKYITVAEFIQFARHVTRKKKNKRKKFKEKSLEDNVYHVMFDEGPLGMGIAPHEGKTIGSEVTAIVDKGQA